MNKTIADELILLKNCNENSNINDNELNKLVDNYLNGDEKDEQVLTEGLEICWNLFRAKYITHINGISSDLYRSPSYGDGIISNCGSELFCSYERNLNYKFLEQIASDYNKVDSGWENQNVIFSSGMSALMLVVESYIYSLRKSQYTKRIVVYGAYFESRMYLDFIVNNQVEIIRCENEDELITEIEKGFDFLWIEPVCYNWGLDVLSLPMVINKINESVRDNKPRIILFDSTLVGNLLPMDQLLSALKLIPNMIVANVNSLLKLNQQGLEFTNAGLVALYSKKNKQSQFTNVEFSKLLIKMRTVYGTGLDFRSVFLLDNSFTFNKELVGNYCSRVFLNNELLAKSLKCGALFAKISHPSLSKNSTYTWAKAPFVVLVLEQDLIENYELLLAVIKYEIQKRNLCLKMGSSFGFRHSRYEAIIPNISKNKVVFKIAMGHDYTSQRNYIIKLFQELAEFMSIQDLKEKYPDVIPLNLRNDMNEQAK